MDLTDIPGAAWGVLAAAVTVVGTIAGVVGKVLGSRSKQAMTERRAAAEEREADAELGAAKATAHATIRTAEIEADVTISKRLMDRLDTLETKQDELAAAHAKCETGRQVDRLRHEQQRRQDRRECEAEIADLRASMIGIVDRAIRDRTAELAEEEGTDELEHVLERDTGIHDLTVVRDRLLHPPARTPVPPSRDAAAWRDLPPPTRREEPES